MELPELVPIDYRGNLVALLPERLVHSVVPRLRTRPAGDSELRLGREVLRGRLPGDCGDKLGEVWACRAIGAEPELETVAAIDTPAERRSVTRRGARAAGALANGGPRE